MCIDIRKLYDKMQLANLFFLFLAVSAVQGTCYKYIALALSDLSLPCILILKI